MSQTTITSLEAGLRAAIQGELERIVAEEIEVAIERAAEAIRGRIARSAGATAIKLGRYVDFYSDQNRIVISVQMPADKGGAS